MKLSLRGKAANLNRAMVLGLVTAFLLLICPSYAEGRMLRVGLAAPNTVYSKISLGFDGPHTVSPTYGRPPVLEYTGPSNYEVERQAGNFELSTATFNHIREVDMTQYPSGLALVTAKGLRMVHPSEKNGDGTRVWADSVIENISFALISEGSSPKFALFDSSSVISPLRGGFFQFYNYTYRGSLSLYFESIDGVFPINTIELEDYLYGVVPREMPSTWNLEALKAQAVCARTYALSSLGKYADWDYDLAPTIHSQVYGGYDAEVEATNKAVDSTRGEELFYGDDRVECFFHASNGGYMAASEDVFVTKLPYFNPKPDPYTEVLKHEWELEIDGAALSAYIGRQGEDIGDFLYIDKLVTNPSRRVDSLRIVGTAGSYTMEGSTFQYLTDIDSLYFGLSPKPAESGQAPTEGAGSKGVSVLTAKGLVSQPMEKFYVMGREGKIAKLSSNMVKTANSLLPLEGAQDRRKQPFHWDQLSKGTKIYGYGNGHGLGLSQWGAQVMAEQGKSYADILKFYYDGTSLKKN